MNQYITDPRKIVFPVLNEVLRMAEFYGSHDEALPSDRGRILFQGSGYFYFVLAIGIPEKNLRKVSRTLNGSLHPQAAIILEDMVKESINMHHGSYSIH